MTTYLHTEAKNLPDPRICPRCLRPLGWLWSADRGGYVTHYNASCSSAALVRRATAADLDVWEMNRILREVQVRI